MRGTNHELLEIEAGVSDPQPIPHRTFVNSRQPYGTGSYDIAPEPFVSATVGRNINCQAEEFYETRRYLANLGLANEGYKEDDSGYKTPRYDYDPVLSTMVRPEKLHVAHLYAADIGEIVLRNFGNDKGELRKPRDVMRRIVRFTRKYNTTIRRENENLQDDLLFELGLTANGPRRALGEDALETESLAMTNGIFKLSGTLGAFGVGNAFGFTFEPSARSFLQSERSKALDMAVDVLKVRLDRDLEDKILSSEHHVTLIRLGLNAPTWAVFPGSKGEQEVPETFVTEFDPKARAIIPNAS